MASRCVDSGRVYEGLAARSLSGVAEWTAPESEQRRRTAGGNGTIWTDKPYTKHALTFSNNKLFYNNSSELTSATKYTMKTNVHHNIVQGSARVSVTDLALIHHRV